MKKNEIDSEEFLELFKKRFQIQQQNITYVMGFLANLKEDSPNELKLLLNISGYINIVSFDIKIITKDIIVANDEWSKRHYARQACLISYEIINDIFELLGINFKKIIKSIPNDQVNIHSAVKEIRSSLNKFKEENSKKFYSIRNSVIAHREKESTKQLKSIIEINWEEILLTTIEFEKLLKNIEGAIQKIIEFLLVRLSMK